MLGKIEGIDIDEYISHTNDYEDSVKQHSCLEIFAKSICLGIVVLVIGTLLVWTLIYGGYSIPQVASPHFKHIPQFKHYNNTSYGKNQLLNETSNGDILTQKILLNEAQEIQEKLLRWEKWQNDSRHL